METISKCLFIHSNIESITILDSVTVIEQEAFESATSLTTVTLGKSIKVINNWAFSYCSNLTSIIMPDSLTELGIGIFMGCKSLKTAVLTNKLKNISNSLFYDCNNLTDFVIPELATVIGVRSFCNCYSITNIIIPESVTVIEESAFSMCSSITKITIPKSVTSVKLAAFFLCKSIKTLVIQTNAEPLLSGINHFQMTEIDTIVFEGYSPSVLNDVTLQRQVKCIIFNVSSSSSSRLLYSTNTLPSLKDYSKLSVLVIEKLGRSYSIPESFLACENVNIYIADDISEINSNAFKDCSIKEFGYFGLTNLNGDFLKNAKNVETVILADDYSTDSIGGVTPTQRSTGAPSFSVDISSEEEKVNITYHERPPPPEPEKNPESEKNPEPGNPNKGNETTDGKGDGKEDGQGGGKGDGKGKNTGMIVGIVIGVIAAIAIIAVISFFIIRKRQSNQNTDNDQGDQI